jgi:hypothetical protein
VFEGEDVHSGEDYNDGMISPNIEIMMKKCYLKRWSIAQQEDQDSRSAITSPLILPPFECLPFISWK